MHSFLTLQLVTREVQMFLKGRRAPISKENATIYGTTILTWSFIYPAYFSRVCSCKSSTCCGRHEGVLKSSQVAPQALPLDYGHFAAEAEVAYGTDGILEKKAVAAKQKADEAAAMAEAAKKLAAEAEELAQEAKSLAGSDDEVIQVPGFCE